ncbi:uncharacterized protein LOC111052505 [Nilaparvata lugens]|uniref:uncharacterized protein LOC111052505 n=1 Tax=Nilaparvata lugens TaxID=108931 RepID=UPI00193D7B80|nr:uncharacterized protein LOC111052505 [Nilaparvata lugens]
MFSKADVLLYIASLFLQESIQQNTSGPTIIPKADFNLKGETIEFCRVLHLPCSEIPPVIDYITSISNDQRHQIMDVGWKQYGNHTNRHDTAMSAILFCFEPDQTKDKQKSFDSTQTDAYNNIFDICEKPTTFLARRLHDSLQKGGEDLSYQSIMCTSTGDELSQFDKNFPSLKYKSFTEEIDKKLKDDDLKKFLKDLLTPPYRSNDKADDKKTADLVKLIPTGNNDKCTADATSQEFYDMMHKESFDQIKAVGEMWNKNNANVDIVAAIANRCASHLGSCFKRICE